MRGHLFTLLLLAALMSSAQAQTTSYRADWSSIDQRPIPQWWGDAKFGIFIHWGVYAVPAFSKVGEYSEWYWNALSGGKKEYVDFHRQNYGEGFTYADFVPMFRAELFNPDHWADIFQRSGAKYVVLTSKHHEGFTLWPNKEADRSWGRPWNAVATGPRRDVLGDLTKSVRQAGLKMGYYYSLYEWYNPLYKANPALYVEKHMIPQFKDLVTNYQPSVIFSDGEWDHPDTLWRSTEILSWLFNEAPNRDEVVVNDRWGKGVRHHHGDYYTTEYGSGMADAAHPWEESRGIAFSYGYSRTENIDDYRSGLELTLMLIDIVSRGGNLLLDIGPTADGRIPVIMQQRLLEMGDWLRVNGEAIYGTRTWKTPCQWSAGTVKDAERGEYMLEYDILKLTLRPEPGFAVKEVFFTRKDNNLYAICPRYPDGQLRLKNVSLPKNGSVSMLGAGKPLKWRQQGADLIIEVPPMNPMDLPSKYAVTFKVSGVGR